MWKEDSLPALETPFTFTEWLSRLSDTRIP